MKCPFCGNIDTKVLDSRALEDNTVIRRRRNCESCEQRFTTYERLDTITFYVIKKNGTRELFDRNKIMNGLLRSCNKRTVSVEQMERIANEIELSCQNLMKKEIESQEIGEMVMEKLKVLDEISYVRFASVYRQFKDIDTFMDELGKMLKDKK